MHTPDDPIVLSSQAMQAILREAIKLIDQTFGLNYAMKNPALLSAIAKIGADHYAAQSCARCRGIKS